MAAGDVLPFVLLFALAAAVIGFVVARTRERIRRARGNPVAPVPVPPEEVELEEGPVFACMGCGSPSVRQAKASEGIVPGGGALLTWICGRCGRRGPALEFDDPTAYREFVKALNEDAARKEPRAP